MLKSFLAQKSTKGGLVGLLFTGVAYLTGEIAWEAAAWFAAATVGSVILPEDAIKRKIREIRGKEKMDAGV